MTKVVLLAGNGRSTTMVYHMLVEAFGDVHVLIEESVPLSRFIKHRIKTLGLLTVIGQVMFQVGIVPLLRMFAASRQQQIIKEHLLGTSPIPAEHVTHVQSANSPKAHDLLQQHNPAVVVINGTRILSTETLQCVSAPFINMHAGITPLYRGVHGAYWARAQGDAKHCGVTVHCVDAGVDTGEIIAQDTIAITSADNFTSYPLLQVAAGLPLLKQTVYDALNNQLETMSPPAGTSRCWSHPTAWGYVWRVMRGVK